MNKILSLPIGYDACNAVLTSLQNNHPFSIYALNANVLANFKTDKHMVEIDTSNDDFDFANHVEIDDLNKVQGVFPLMVKHDSENNEDIIDSILFSVDNAIIFKDCIVNCLKMAGISLETLYDDTNRLFDCIMGSSVDNVTYTMYPKMAIDTDGYYNFETRCELVFSVDYGMLVIELKFISKMIANGLEFGAVLEYDLADLAKAVLA